MAGSAAPRTRGATAGARGATPKARSAAPAKRAPAPGRGKAAAPSFTFGRWSKVGLLVALVMIGLPLAHALFGEIFALLGGAVLFGFLLGRWTLK